MHLPVVRNKTKFEMELGNFKWTALWAVLIFQLLISIVCFESGTIEEKRHVFGDSRKLRRSKAELKFQLAG